MNHPNPILLCSPKKETFNDNLIFMIARYCIYLLPIIGHTYNDIRSQLLSNLSKSHFTSLCVLLKSGVLLWLGRKQKRGGGSFDWTTLTLMEGLYVMLGAALMLEILVLYDGH